MFDKKMDIDISKERFEDLLSQYNRQVFVSNELAEWAIIENEFAEGRFDLEYFMVWSMGNRHYAGDLDKTERNTEERLYTSFMYYVPTEWKRKCNNYFNIFLNATLTDAKGMSQQLFASVFLFCSTKIYQ
jgi:hypothetical protein